MFQLKHNPKSKRPPPQIYSEQQRQFTEMLQRIEQEVLRQSKLAFNIMIISITIGLFLFLVGFILIQGGQTTLATMSAAVGSLSEITGGIGLITYKTTSETLNHLAEIMRDILIENTANNQDEN